MLFPHSCFFNYLVSYRSMLYSLHHGNEIYLSSATQNIPTTQYRKPELVYQATTTPLKFSVLTSTLNVCYFYERVAASIYPNYIDIDMNLLRIKISDWPFQECIIINSRNYRSSTN